MNVPDLPDVPEDLTILDGATTSVQSIGGWYAQILARRRRLNIWYVKSVYKHISYILFFYNMCCLYCLPI